MNHFILSCWLIFNSVLIYQNHVSTKQVSGLPLDLEHLLPIFQSPLLQSEEVQFRLTGILLFLSFCHFAGIGDKWQRGPARQVYIYVQQETPVFYILLQKRYQINSNYPELVHRLLMLKIMFNIQLSSLLPSLLHKRS